MKWILLTTAYVSIMGMSFSSQANTKAPEILFSGTTVAAGHDRGNGGDTTCEMEFIRVSETIRDWIKAGGAKSLDYSKTPGINAASYTAKMYKAMGSNTIVSCTSDQSKVRKGGSDKTCINFKDKNNVNRILCHRESFNQLPEENKHFDAHHEIAGVAGIETNGRRETSRFPLTVQLKTRYSEVLVGHLSVEPLTKSTSDPSHWHLEDLFQNGYYIRVKPKPQVVAISFKSGSRDFNARFRSRNPSEKDKGFLCKIKRRYIKSSAKHRIPKTSKVLFTDHDMDYIENFDESTQLTTKGDLLLRLFSSHINEINTYITLYYNIEKDEYPTLHHLRERCNKLDFEIVPVGR